jgi:hypothetical protein
LCCLAFLCLWAPATGLLSAKGINYEGNWSSFSQVLKLSSSINLNGLSQFL